MFSHPLSEQASYKIPSKLKWINYAKAEPAWDRCVQDAVQRMAEKLDAKLRSNGNNRYKCTNLSQSEQEGLVWLQMKISENKIAVTEADKGGEILRVTPELLRKKGAWKA